MRKFILVSEDCSSLLKEYVREILETSLAVRRDFESSLNRFDASSSAEIPTSFSGSKLVNKDGTPIKFYHGTRSQFDHFSKEFLDTSGTNIPTNYLGFFFTTSEEVAKIYTSKGLDPRQGPAKGGRINQYILDVKNPYFITEKKYWQWGRGTPGEMEDLVTRLRSYGHDGVVMPSVWRGRGKGAYDVVVFSSNQIKKIS